jgi:hypothetical protein
MLYHTLTPACHWRNPPSPERGRAGFDSPARRCFSLGIVLEPVQQHEKLCISPIPLHFWDAVYFDIFRSVRRHEKYSVLVKMQSFTYSTFYCILKCSAFSPNSAFGNAEIENAVSAERTLSVDEPCSIINSVKPHSLQRTLQFHASELCQGS